MQPNRLDNQNSQPQKDRQRILAKLNRAERLLNTNESNTQP